MAKSLPKSKPNQVVTKNVSAIHISAGLSLTQRKLVNAMLYHAYDELLVEDTHSINVALLMEMIGFESRNQDHLKKSIRGLTEKSVEWDIMEDDGTSLWEVSTLLSYARIRKGECTYRYDKSLAEKLKNPDVFAKINLSVVRDIRSAHSLVLYENCYRYIGVGQTPKWSVEVFRKLMAVNHLASYQQFKFLKRDLITPAIKEVNKVSNVQISLETVMSGRSVVAIQFLVRPNTQLALLEIDSEDEIISTAAYKALLREGIGKRLAYEWVKDFGEAFVLEKIELAADNDARGKIKSSRSGYIISAIKNDYHSDVTVKRNQQADIDRVRLERRDIEIELEVTKKHLKRVEFSYRADCIELIEAAFMILTDNEKSMAYDKFKNGFPSKIFSDDFVRNQWQGRLIFSDARKFWSSRGVAFPDPDVATQGDSKRNASQLRERVKQLEGQLI
jgi:plasmid replication initiation protein